MLKDNVASRNMYFCIIIVEFGFGHDSASKLSVRNVLKVRLKLNG